MWLPLRTSLPALAVASLFASASAAAPAPVAWDYWRSHDEAQQQAIDHTAWTQFLEGYVVVGDDGIHRVRYGQVQPADRRALEAYVARLAATPIRRFRRAEQLAYWIDLYNALTVKVVLDHYPVASIRDISISPGLFSTGPWGRPLVSVEGKPIRLDDIEHRILRPLWRDPRIHYALNCASLGCPDLAREAFTPERTERLLEAGARAYVNHSRGVSLEAGRLTVSSLYVWFEDDFGGAAGVLAHLRRYAAPGLASRLAGAGGIDGHAYDWSLNDADGP